MKYALLFVCLCYSCYTLAQTTIKRNGNTFTFSPRSSAKVLNPMSGKTENSPIAPRPIKMNGKPIYELRKVTDGPTITIGDDKTVKLSEYLVIKLKHDLALLDDGLYILSVTNTVVDKNGKLVYYEFSGIQKETATGKDKADRKTNIDGKGPTFVRYSFSDKDIVQTLRTQINERTKSMLENLPTMTASKIKDLSVNCTGELFNMTSIIKVRNHEVTFEPCYFCL